MPLLKTPWVAREKWNRNSHSWFLNEAKRLPLLPKATRNVYFYYVFNVFWGPACQTECRQTHGDPGGSPNSEPRLPHGSRSADKQISEPPLKNSKAAKQKRNSMNSSSLASPTFCCGRTVDLNRNRRVVNRSFRPGGVFSFVFYFCAKSQEKHVFFILFSGNWPQAAGSWFGLHGKIKTRPVHVQKHSKTTPRSKMAIWWKSWGAFDVHRLPCPGKGSLLL